MTLSIGLIGLGRIAQSHIAALEQLADVDVVAGCDIAPGRCLTFHGEARPVHTDLADLIRHQLDAVIVAPPAAAHAQVCADLLAWPRPPARILMEKPAADRLDAVVAMFSASATTQLDVIYHAAHAPEVEWAAARLPDWSAWHGPIVAYEAYFCDPYGGQARQARRQVYLSSWLDSGINALSIAHRLMRPERVSSLDLLDPKGSVYTATLAFGPLVPDADAQSVRTPLAHARIRTSWDVPAPVKWTELTFASGATLQLDHQAISGAFQPSHGQGESFGYDGAHPRLVTHYIRAFSSLLLGDGAHLGTPESLLLHRLLFTKVREAEEVSAFSARPSR